LWLFQSIKKQTTQLYLNKKMNSKKPNVFTSCYKMIFFLSNLNISLSELRAKNAKIMLHIICLLVPSQKTNKLKIQQNNQLLIYPLYFFWHLVERHNNCKCESGTLHKLYGIYIWVVYSEYLGEQLGNLGEPNKIPWEHIGNKGKNKKSLSLTWALSWWFERQPL